MELSNHRTIEPLNHRTIEPSNHPTIQPSNHQTMIAEYETNVMALVKTNYLAHSKPNQQHAISKTTVQSIHKQLYYASVYIRQLKGDEQKAAMEKYAQLLDWVDQAEKFHRRRTQALHDKQLLVKFFHDTNDAESMADKVLADLAEHNLKHQLVGVSGFFATDGSVQLECRLAYKMPESYICVRLPWPSASKMVDQ